MYQAIPPSDTASNAAPTPATPVDLQYQLYQQQQQQRYQTARQPSVSSFFQSSSSVSASAPSKPPSKPAHAATTAASAGRATPYTNIYTRPTPAPPSTTRRNAFSRYLTRLGRSLALLGLSIFSAVFSVGTLGLFMIISSFASGWLSVIFTTFFVLNLLMCFIGPLTKLDVYLSHQRHRLQQAVLAESVDIFADCV
ncbi:hypothetical protein H310_12350 [Aphanomyces invadans]|uniref:Uncharacterized protein n=1 Tax=Aphanomyces invadans TaxID=157072 RepID=A0A024TJK1_9STRA|nr:hypothetical protein H310_12350 [Aphanomyces invadans]ETV93786.1 hypothetical protein H310_12350 [Aphanomyces invadans]|eukprot:XP_008877595.1 hypothetical protein H310_12350 [Aphanomyces invadans]